MILNIINRNANIYISQNRKTILSTYGVTARTNTSKPKLEQMLYYKNTKLRSRRKGPQWQYIHSTGELWRLRQASCRGGTLVLLYHPPFLKKPALRRYPLLKKKEEKEKEKRKEKKYSIQRSIAILVNIGLAALLQPLLPQQVYRMSG